MSKLLILITIMLTAQMFIIGQTNSYLTFTKKIKNTNNYYTGESISAQNMRIAQDEALSNLLKQIAVNVSSSFQKNIVEENNDSIKETVTSILKTYATASLSSVNYKKDFYDNQTYVFAYILKKKVNKIFEKRKNLAYDIFQNAVEFEGNADYGDALKYYYYTTILINSIPEQNIKIDEVNLKTEIPKRITNIIKGVRFKVHSVKRISKKEKIISFYVSENGKAVSNLQISFWDGNNFIDAEAKDGKLNINLVGGSVNFKKLTVKIKYEYYTNRTEIKEVGELWNLVKRSKFDNSFIVDINSNIKVTNSPYKRTSSAAGVKNSAKTKNIPALINNKNSEIKLTLTSGNINGKTINNIKKNAIVFLDLLSKNDISNIKQFLKKDTFLINKVKGLIKYNSIKIIDSDIKAKLNKTPAGYEIREVKVLCNYYYLNKQTTEYLILDFDAVGKLYDVNFGIMDKLYDDFVEKSVFGNDWGNRQTIIKFIEKYRTAYLTRNIGLINKIFAENALIIVGRVLKVNKKTNTDMVNYVQLNKKQPRYEQIKYTKKEYLKKLTRLFKIRKDIFLGYSNFSIYRKTNTTGVYGISLRQGYESTGYNDEGYLFLLIDFNKAQPQIYVRSWQPQEWDTAALIGLSNFRINN